MKRKAIALVSGGLDSLLAAKVIQEQGIEVQGVCFVMSAAAISVERFSRNVREAAGDAGIPVKVVDISKEFLAVLKSPKHGYGSQVNPCIDCKIFMLRKAKKMMKEERAGFVVTGEVLGERPMSQRRDALNIITKGAGLEGYLLRPLSAKLMEETVPEKEGAVDREKLLDINGRSRKRQFELAEKYEIEKYFYPAGGCLLTDPAFSQKVKDLMKTGNLTAKNIDLLKYGRHFRLDNETKVVVGRDDKDNNAITGLKQEKDIVLRLKDKPGPYALLQGKKSEGHIKTAAALVVSHSKAKKEKQAAVEFWADEAKKEVIVAHSLKKDEMDKMRV
jgi:tRNA U34 2-thiouridine synthase MnmA/TrmU